MWSIGEAGGVNILLMWEANINTAIYFLKNFSWLEDVG